MLMSLLVAAFALSWAQASTIYGFCRTYGSTGLVTIDTSNPTAATRIKSNVQPTAGAIKESVMYISAFDDDFNSLFYSVNLSTGKTTKISTLPESLGSPTDMAYNYADDKMYFITNSANEDVSTSLLGTIDLATGKTKTVKADLGFYARAMTIAADGTMYYVTRDGMLCTYDIARGSTKQIGSTGVTPRSTFGSMGCDRSSNTLYWATESATGYVNHLYTVDAATAQATDLGVIGTTSNGEGYWTVALDAPYKASEQAAPRKVENLTATYDPTGALKVTLKWTNPDSTVNDQPLNSISSVVVTRGETVVATLTDAKPGQTSTWVDNVPAAGTYRYHVQAVNEAGTSADRFVDVYAGHDVPGPAVLALADLYGSNKVANVVTWHTPVAGSHGGYLDTQSLSYDVIRLNDGAMLAKAQKFAPDTKGMMTYTDENLPSLQRYTYQIVAHNADGTGDTAVTNYIVNGPAAQLPLEADFNKKADALLWTSYNANGDASQFEWHYYSMLNRNFYIYQADQSNYAADFLVSPPLEFTEGHTYRVTVSCCNTFAPYPEAVTVYTMGGNAPHGAIVGEPLTDPVKVSHPNELRDYTFDLSKITDDRKGTDHDTFTSFLAVACLSDPAMQMLLVGNVKIEDTTGQSTGLNSIDADQASTASHDGDIFSIEGRYMGKASAVKAILPSGIYVVKTGKAAHKIAVR